MEVNWTSKRKIINYVQISPSNWQTLSQLSDYFSRACLIDSTSQTLWLIKFFTHLNGLHNAMQNSRADFLPNSGRCQLWNEISVELNSIESFYFAHAYSDTQFLWFSLDQMWTACVICQKANDLAIKVIKFHSITHHTIIIQLPLVLVRVGLSTNRVRLALSFRMFGHRCV